MTGLAIIFLTLLLLREALGQWVSRLNVAALDQPLPDELRALYDADKLAKVREQVTAKARFGNLVSVVDLAALLCVWFGGLFEQLDRWVRDLHPEPIVRGLVFILILALAKALLDLPFSIWHTFVLEARFGFNRTTPQTFALDLLKSLALSLLLGLPILALLLYFFEHAGSWAWLWAWLAMTAITLGLQVILPGWILPLFNRYENLPEGELRTTIEAYARRVGFALQGIYVMDGSRRSSRANAFFVGLGKNRRIALFDTLIDSLSQRELLAVLAHEVGHFKRGHIPKLTTLGIVHTGLLFFALSLCLHQPAVFAAFGVSQPSVYAGLVFFALLYSPLELLLAPAMHALERRYEFEADAFAATTTGDHEAMAGALGKLGVDNLAHPTPHPWQVALHFSHPPLVDRLRALRVLPRGSALP